MFEICYVGFDHGRGSWIKSSKRSRVLCLVSRISYLVCLVSRKVSGGIAIGGRWSCGELGALGPRRIQEQTAHADLDCVRRGQVQGRLVKGPSCQRAGQSGVEQLRIARRRGALERQRCGEGQAQVEAQVQVGVEPNCRVAKNRPDQTRPEQRRARDRS